MALFKKKNDKKDNNILQPGLKPVAEQNKLSGNEFDFDSINPINDENSNNSLPDLDLPDFDSLLNEKDTSSLQKVSEDKDIEKIETKNDENPSTDANQNNEIPEIKDEVSSFAIDDSVNLFDGDYFVSLSNYKAIFDRLDDLDQNFKDFNKTSDEFFSLYNGKENLLKNSDSAFEEVHRKILLIDGICFKDD